MTPVLFLIAQVVGLCGGIVYTLDDAYIHLALAQRLLEGHYGINPGEFAAPSSSILWPFLLAPLSFARIGEFVPLAIDLVCLFVTLRWLLRGLKTRMTPIGAVATMVGGAFAFNLYGLPLSGMEHSLQVMLVVVIGISLTEQRYAWPFWVSLILLPLVRYEGLAISLPTLAYLFLASRHRLMAVAAGMLIGIGVGGFTLYLHGNGVGLLPGSVLAVQRPLTLETIVINTEAQLYFVGIAAFAAVLLFREDKALQAVLLVAAPTAAHLMFGAYGDFSRYQIYFDLWIAILFVSVYWRSALIERTWLNVLLVAGLLVASVDTMLVTLTAPTASRNIADQQGQMANILRNHLDEPVAIGDLGLVAFRSRQHILDLEGLATYEVFHLKDGRPPDIWIAELMARHKVEHAMVYEDMYAPWPANWIHVATLHLPLPCVTPGARDHVAFYSTNPAAADRFRAAIAGYRASSRLGAMTLVVSDSNAPAPRATIDPRADACSEFYIFQLNINLFARAARRARLEVFRALPWLGRLLPSIDPS